LDTPKDPFDTLMNAAHDQTLWILIGGPAALLLLVIAVYVVLIQLKKRREAAELKQAIEESGQKLELVRPDGTRAGAALEDDADELLTDEAEEDGDAPSRPFGADEPTAKLPIHYEEPEAAEEAEPAVPLRMDVEDVRRTDRASWLGRLKSGLAKTRDSLRGSLESLFTGQTKLDHGVLEQLHEVLYRADIGVATADKLVGAVRAKLGKDEAASWPAVSQCLKDEMRAILQKSQAPLARPDQPPFVVLIVGVNGVGKTTSIGKLGAHFLAADQTVLLAAGDTFRAAAIEQLEVWGQRLGVDVVRHKQGSDPAAVAYDGVKAAIARQVDVLLIDTAGRLHSKNELMAELAKVNRVIGKDLPGAPHATWLVIDATTGQNAVQQVKAFKEVVGVTGLVVTKLDGTAKGGVLVGIADQFGLPIHYIGVGEKAADLRAFNVDDYVESMF
jgi:fused signal recognition particle receptor